MASLTPGVLPKLLENAGNKNVKVTGEHRSAVLQVIEIVPCPGGGDDDENDPWNWNSRPRGFLLKLSDSVHSAYVSIAEEDDLDLIYSDKVQLGKLVYVSRLESASPVPVLRGLKVVAVPKCKSKSKSAPSSAPLVCVGNPDPILHLPKPQAKTRSSKSSTLSPRTKNKTKVAVVVDSSTTTRKLSLDSARRAWDAGTKTTTASHSHHFKSRTKQFSSPPCPAVSDKKLFTKIKAPHKHPTSSPSPPLKNKTETLSPNSKNKSSKKEFKFLSEETLPNHFVKFPRTCKTWSDQKISWSVLPSIISDLGKGAIFRRDAAFLGAVRALEEASASEGVIHCMCMFAELRESSHKVSAGPLMEKFLNLHQNMEEAAMAVDSLFNTSHPDVKSSSLKGRRAWVSHVYKTSTSTNATSWVEAALGANISKFSLFRAQGNGGIPNGEKYHYVVVENAPAESNLDNSTPQTKQNRPRLVPALKKMSTERDQYPKENRLKETARLAEKLLFVCCEWFLKYLEDSLNVGFRLNKEEGIPEIARLLGQLKRVNLWLDDLIKRRIYVDKRIKSLQKKLYEFVLEHIDSVVSSN